MNTIFFNRLPFAVLVSISLLWATGCASVSSSQTETDDAYFNSSDIRKEKEAATVAALKKASEEANTPASSSGSNVDYVNPNYKASGKSGYDGNTSSNNYSNDFYSSNYSSPYYSGFYSGGYSWMPGPFNYGSSFYMCYPSWYGSGWGSSLILGTRPYNPWMMNSGFGMGYGMNYGMGYGMGFGNSLFYNNYDPFYSPAFGYYGYNPFASWNYSPYSNFYNPYQTGTYFNPGNSNNEPSASGGLIKTNLPISGMTGGDPGATGGRFGTPVRGGRMNTEPQQPGGQPVVNNPNTETPNTRSNSSIFRHESNSNQGQVVIPPPVTNNPDRNTNNNSGFWRNDNNNSNDFFRSNNSGSGSGNSSSGSGTGNTSGGGSRGGASMSGGRRR
jgi:uncharacterized membrane protein YgcG